MDIPDVTAPTRIRTYEGAFNLRDLGGLRTRDGRSIRCGRIFRSEYPGYVDGGAPDALRELGIQVVVDLRRRSEAHRECVDWLSRGVRYSRWPLSAGNESSWRARYSDYLEHRPAPVVGALREIMQSSARGVLFHCAAGKDRTGIVAAILLRIVGVSDDDIVADYLLSGDSVEEVLTRLRAIDLYAETLRDVGAADQMPRADLIGSMLAWLDRRGGAEEWLLGQGIEAQELAAFRSTMLVP